MIVAPVKDNQEIKVDNKKTRKTTLRA
ncbi:hypothetical protein A2U01_0087272, partial [Trifolium medium]|nr:hypothetical protein [Trifolium medium]